MGLLKQIEEDFEKSIKSKDYNLLAVLRDIKTALSNKKVELRSIKKEITDDIIINIIQKQAKRRREAMDIYKKGNREDLFAKEAEELEFLSKYLPAELDDSEIIKIVVEVIKKIDAQGMKDFGKVMGMTIKKVKGMAQGDKIKQIVQEQLSNF